MDSPLLKPRAVFNSENMFAVFVLGLPLVVYLRTMAPSITWRNNGVDSGDLVTAAFTGGVPHPPGYPLYSVLAQSFTAFPVGDVACRVNLFSALCAAFAIFVVFTIACAWMPGRQNSVAAASALFLAFTPRLWSQATLAEVYALNALLAFIVLGGFMLWDRRPALRWVAVIALGLGIAHQPTILLLLPGIIVLLWRRATMRDAVVGLAIVLVIAGALDLTLLVRAWNDAPVNWGDPRTLDRWWWVVSGALYRNFLFAVPFADYPARLTLIAQSFVGAFGIVGVVVACIGNGMLVRRSPHVGIAFFLCFAGFVVFTLGYASSDAFVYLIPADGIVALWIGYALGTAIDALARRNWKAGIIVAAAIWLFPLGNLIGNFAALDLSNDTSARDYGRAVFAAIPHNALIVADHDEQVFALWYISYVEQPESRAMVVVPGLLAFDWYRAQLQRHYPDWIFPPLALAWDDWLRQLVAANKERHSVFWVERDPQFEQYFEFRESGPVFQVIGSR